MNYLLKFEINQIERNEKNYITPGAVVIVCYFMWK